MITLSGGPNGGDLIDAPDWIDNEVRTINGELYRRVGDQAVFIGLAS